MAVSTLELYLTPAFTYESFKKNILSFKTWGFLVLSLCDGEGHEPLFPLAYNIERRNCSSLRKLEMLWPNALFGDSESLAKEETYPYITSWSESLDCVRI